MKKTVLETLLSKGDFQTLFVSEIGWDNPSNSKFPSLETQDKKYDFEVVAELRSFRILKCETDTIPSNSECRVIDIHVRKFAHEYILIFAKKTSFHHRWLVPVKKVDKRDLVSIEYTSFPQTDRLLEKLNEISFSHEDNPTIGDVTERVQHSFIVNSEKITKNFYAGFKKEHKAFVDFISGIEKTSEQGEKDRQWYASVMLNRLMFCYFIQKKGFLAGNKSYLSDKLAEVKRLQGENKFFSSFYRGFLRSMFHEGLNSPRHSEDFENKYGRIPYLNGGMFDEHRIEKDYKDIDIADEAFERLFKFFDEWEWHLDTRISASGKDINPDVLGYIFEQYINDRAQMGAYYTKEDITEYIGRNTILPFLLEKVKGTSSNKDFSTDGYVWKTLKESGDKYIFDATKKGYELRRNIPEEIMKGIISPEMRQEYTETPIGDLPKNHIPLSELRSDWNKPTPEEFALPTEIWRETIDRLERCDEITNKIQEGEMTSVNDLITYNLDIRSFVTDLLQQGDKLFVEHFYDALKSVSILDPTCGSGAFLFAALNILEPLYELAIERMKEFRDNLSPDKKKELLEIEENHGNNIQYFIYKSIILRNLYGVDIMPEAIEIAKLRLFLKMVAVVEVNMRADNMGLEPLPDIDFNIRCGNTLVGYATMRQLDNDLKFAKTTDEIIANAELKDIIDDELDSVARAYRQFKDIQLGHGNDKETFKTAKDNLRERLNNLNALLNKRLFMASHSINVSEGEDFTQTIEYRNWLLSHQPFHWLADFYDIIEGNGGFDVIIGNPPYVEYNKRDSTTKKAISDIYKLKGYDTIECGNLYAYCVERSYKILNSIGQFGMIVPNSSISAKKMGPLQKLFTNKGLTWISNYSWRPSKLFEGADMLLAILITCPSPSKHIYSTVYKKWYNEFRPFLFKTVNYIEVSENIIDGALPKIGSRVTLSILDKEKLNDKGRTLPSYFINNSEWRLFYFRAVQYWFKILTKEPIYDEDGVNKVTGEMKSLFFESVDIRNAAVSLLSSSTYFLYYIVWSSCQVVNNRDFNINVDFDKFPLYSLKKLSSLGMKLQQDYQANSKIKERNYSKKGRTFSMQKQHFYIKFSKSIINEIDYVLAEHYKFSEEELDYIINYDIKYRLGDELTE